MSRSLGMLVGVAVFGVLCVACLMRNAPRIEDDIRNRAVAAIGTAGLPNVRVEVSGRDVDLFGPGAALEMAASALTAVRGVRKTTSHAETAVATPVSPQETTEAERETARRAAFEGEIRRELAGRSIGFRSGSAELLPTGQVVLDQVAPLLGRAADLRIQIEGHTDATGNADANLRLSQRRAEVVLRYLVARGVSEERLTAIGFGQTRPVADNATSEGRQANRRIEFRVSQEN